MRKREMTRDIVITPDYVPADKMDDPRYAHMGHGDVSPDWVPDSRNLAPDDPEQDWPPRAQQLERKQRNREAEAAERKRRQEVIRTHRLNETISNVILKQDADE